MEKHEITKVRRDVVRRELRLLSKEQLTPHMLRLHFHSEQLEGFDSPSPDDHIKIFLPTDGDQAQVMRDYTPRAWDAAAGTFTLDFALHDAGPATNWARSAQPGDTLQIGGPKGSAVVPDDFDWYLLIGDATALPSFSRRLEALRAGVHVTVLTLVTEPGENLDFQTAAACQAHWLPASGTSQGDAAILIAALEQIQTPPGEGYVWIAAEATVSQQLYLYFTEQRAHPRQWIKASAYWKRSETAS